LIEKLNDIKIGRFITLKNVKKEPNQFVGIMPVYTFSIYIGKAKIIDNKLFIAENIEELRLNVLNDMIKTLQKHYK